jgi:oxygen-independent coproporphyrinogen-3 oxidase
VESILQEMDLRNTYLKNKSIETIYFGGGTPSLLSEKELFSILEKLYKNYDISSNAEITLEANPDDLTLEKLKELKRLEINRLSIGLQSFNDEELVWMNRAHKASDNEMSVKRSQDKGFENISVDLIYGSKFGHLANWKRTLDQTIALGVKHISSYNLTIEEKTKLGNDLKEKKEMPIDDEKSSELFLEMIHRLEKKDFIHYEISNFGKEDFFSKHNSNYWKGIEYIGFGPSAHSFNGVSRQWNIANNNLYIKNISNKNQKYFEKEELTKENQFNEYVLTSLRTIWGIDEVYLKSKFDSEIVKAFEAKINKYLHTNSIIFKDYKYVLTTEGKLFADKIASELFI